MEGVYVCLQVDSVDIWIQDPKQEGGTASATSRLTVWLILEEFAQFGGGGGWLAGFFTGGFALPV